ncbi:MAG: Lrp/AsnC family transcriptional regulator [Pseudomonadota bacterium]
MAYEPDATDRRILDLLERDARTPVATIARALKLARATVKERMERLEKAGVIAGYTIRLNPILARRRINAHILIDIDPREGKPVAETLTNLAPVRSLYAVSGAHDLIAVVRTETTEELDAVLDAIGATPGVRGTTTAIILSVKLDR